MGRAVLLRLLGSAGAALVIAAGTAARTADIVTPAPASRPSAGTVAAHVLIARCAQEARANTRGLAALRSLCPGIDEAVHDLGLDALLPADWSKQASAQALADLDALAARYAGPAPARQLSVSRLQAIAAGLKPPPVPLSFWERIWAWIRSGLGSASASSSSWLRFLPHWSIGPRAQRLLFAVLAGLILIAIAAAVVMEVRGAGSSRARRGPRPAVRRSSIEGGASKESPAGLTELDFAAPRERPALLLRLLVQALTRSHRLEPDRALTCRELIARARFDTARQREDFGQVALIAERVLYGGPDAAAAAIPEELLSGARALHAQLLATPAGAAFDTAAATATAAGSAS